MYIGNQYGLIDQIDVKDAHTFSGGGFVSQNHLAPSPENLQILQHFELKMVLHLRDPRQALLSWIHYLHYITGGNDGSELLLYFTPRTPAGYFEFSLSRQIDWRTAVRFRFYSRIRTISDWKRRPSSTQSSHSIRSISTTPCQTWQGQCMKRISARPTRRNGDRLLRRTRRSGPRR
jgi:hypothetical protein